jgi:putative Ca2+/H+ antiporter (TMEM165/GDT1 family)
MARLTPLLVAAAVVFVAELGDKTQLLAMSLATRYRPLPVLAGIAIAEAATNLLAVAVGGSLGAALPHAPLRIAGGLLFLVFAWRTWREDDHEDATTVEVRPGHVVRSVAAAMFVAELGDKTMLTTATLAAQESPVLTWIGAPLGIVACGALAVLIGKALGERLPRRTTRVVSVALFTMFGIALVADGIRSL